MIKLTDVTKTYVSKKKKQRVDALKGVSFELGNTGMVFILGKSGSGKSTLLNMLGGLDSPTSGEIVVDGVSMKDFKQADYEGYRNGYVGFIFQEYNLLDEFNVKDNVALALHLSKGDNVDGRVLEALQQVELTEDYLTRRVGEMSGGEKQRIAIARTIVKESKMILADEPTGNLDAATGESIWNILKEQSKSKLVVVVSHDRESAEKYGDRIIEIADGNVISDNGVKNLDDEVKETFTPQKKRLSFKTCLRMGVNNLFRHKVRSICVLLLAILNILSLAITQLCLTYSENLTIAKFIRKYDVDYFTIEEDKVPRKDDLAFLEKNSTYIKFDNGVGIINGKQDIVDMGWSFVGESMELNYNSYYVSTSIFNKIEERLSDIKYDHTKEYYYLDENDEKVYISKVPSSWDFLIGKRTNISRCADTAILAGIVDLNSVSEFSMDYIPTCFVLDGFARFSNNPFYYMYFSEGEVFVDFGGGKQYSGSMTISSHFAGAPEKVVIESGISSTNEITIGDGEIVLTYAMLAALFNVKPSDEYLTRSDNEYELHDIPEQIGQTYHFALYDDDGELVADFGKLKIVGVIFEFSSNQYIEGYLNIETMCKLYSQTCRSFLVRTSSVGNVMSFITHLNKEHSAEVKHAGYIEYINSKEGSSDCVTFAGDFTDYIGSFTIIVGLISVIMTLILILLVTNLITLSITGRKKEIGILSALGTSNKDIAKIFVIETLVIAVITFVTVLIASFIFAGVLNQFYSSSYYKVVLSIPFFNVDILTFVTLVVTSFGLLLIGALLPLRKITKLKPIDAIRKV